MFARRPNAKTPAIAVLFVAALALVGCSTGSGTQLSGRVVGDVTVVSAPVLAVPSPFPSAANTRSRSATVAAVVGLGQAQRIVSVPVQVGDRVSAGDVVAHLDETALVAAIDSARASRRVALAQIELLGARLDDIADARSTIAENRATARDAIAKLTRTRRELTDNLAAAKKQLSALRATQRKLQSIPPGSKPPPGAVPPGGAPDPREIGAGIAKLEKAVGQLEAGIAKIDSGLAQARTGLSKLADASATTADARTTLRGVRTVARVAADGTKVAIQLAEAQRDLAVLRSPVAGVVVAAPRDGESVISGAPVVSIRPDAASAVDAYLPPDQLDGLAVGDSAFVEIDSHPGQQHPATVTLIGVRAVYPPSWVSTTDVHMTRALPVRVTLDDPSVVLPAGTPADVTIQPGSK